MSGRFLSRQVFNTRLTNITSATSNTKLLDIDNTRVYASIFNDSTAIMTLLLSGVDKDGNSEGSAKLTAGRKTVLVAAGGYFETPVDFCGEVWAKWASANGNAEITEYR
jgi:hypothetical protein